MRHILLVILVLISFGTSAQAPPMSIGGPQGINVKRILAQDWMSVPIMADTPVAPLTGSGWPGRGYVVFVAQNPDSICSGCPPADTSLWEYTGQRWKRVGMDYLTKLVFGGEVTQSNTFSRRFFVGSYGAFINGSYYTKVPFTTLTTSPKVADSTSRIDAIVLTPLGPSIKVGVARQVPLKPSIASDEIELSTIYFPPFDTVARFIPVATGVTSVFRVPGKDSIFYSIDTTTFAIKDSIGISKNDTAAMLLPYLRKVDTLSMSNRINLRVRYSDTASMLSPYLRKVDTLSLSNRINLKVNISDTATMLNKYKFTAANGLTKDSTVFRLGGTLNQNTTINGSTNGLTFSNLGSFFANTSIAYIGNSSGEGVGVLNGRARVQKLSGTTSIGLYVSDSVFLQSYNGITEVTSPIQSYTTDTSKFQILTINKTTGSLASYTGAWPSAPLSGSATLDFATTTAQTSSDLTITVTGASEGDVVSLGTPQGVASTNICYTAWVSSTNTVTVRLNNYGTTGVDPGPATFKVKVFK